MQSLHGATEQVGQVRERDAALADQATYAARLEARLLAQHKALQAAARAPRPPLVAAAPARARAPLQPSGSLDVEDLDIGVIRRVVRKLEAPCCPGSLAAIWVQAHLGGFHCRRG